MLEVRERFGIRIPRFLRLCYCKASVYSPKPLCDGYGYTTVKATSKELERNIDSKPLEVQFVDQSIDFMRQETWVIHLGFILTCIPLLIFLIEAVELMR